MNRSTSSTTVGNVKRTQVVLESDECKPTDRAYRFLQFELLRAIADDPTLTQCGLSYFDTLQIRHNGKCWVAVAESTSGG